MMSAFGRYVKLHIPLLAEHKPLFDEGPSKLKGEALEFALAKKQEEPQIDPGQLAELIAQRYGIEVHRTTVQRALKKNRAPRRHGGPNPEPGSADDDPVQAICERIRTESLAYPTSASWEYERVRHYGVASLCASLAVERPLHPFYPARTASALERQAGSAAGAASPSL